MYLCASDVRNFNNVDDWARFELLAADEEEADTYLLVLYFYTMCSTCSEDVPPSVGLVCEDRVLLGASIR